MTRLRNLGRERALIYKTLVLTGLRADELRTLTIGQLDLTPGAAFLQLDAADEKSREGNAVAIRDDLAADLRTWLSDKLAAVQATARIADAPVPSRLPGDTLLFTVPTTLRMVLDRDLKAAGIPKRDDRGRTVDVHAMRTTFGTLLSKGGVAPRTAQAAMRHSDIKLTMGVYTDPRLLDVRSAVESLPALPLPTNRSHSVAPTVAPTGCNPGHSEATAGKKTARRVIAKGGMENAVTGSPVNGNAPLTTGVITGGMSRADRRLAFPNESSEAVLMRVLAQSVEFSADEFRRLGSA